MVIVPLSYIYIDELIRRFLYSARTHDRFGFELDDASGPFFPFPYLFRGNGEVLVCKESHATNYFRYILPTYVEQAAEN